MDSNWGNNNVKDGHVLIVDDNPMNLQILGQLLGKNYHVEFATNGKAALDWLKTDSFDIVLLDINMPEMDGFDVCQVIRQDKKLDEMPVIFISALDDKDSIFKGFELGAQDYVSKPFDSRELYMRVKTHITLKKSKEELKKHNTLLEEKVEERTQKLQQAYNELSSRNEELVIAKEAAEAGNKLKSAFISNISHEIRTPLNGILGFASFIAEPDLSDEERTIYIDALNRSSDRLIKTVTDYMDISLLESKTIKQTPTEFRLSELLEKIYNSYLLLFNSSNVQLKLNLPTPLLNIRIIADQELIFKAISHVLDNAVKYTDVGEIIISLDLENDKAIVKISDTGIGIDADSQEDILKTFSKGKYDIENAIDGNGLGLSIASKILQLNNGSVRIDSKQGVGTNVYLYIDFNQEEFADNKKAEMIKSNLKHILVAEDDDMNYLFMEIILKKFKVKVSRAINGLEAVNMTRNQEDIDLILMDISMPEMDGFTATENIREFNKDVVIIVQTAYDQPGSSGKAKKTGANEYITKPIAKTHLYKLIETYFNV